MQGRALTRRRALVMIAATGAFPSALLAAGKQPFEWRGTALGADARLLLYADDRKAARAAVEACIAEIARAEAIFSLHIASSEISRLNRAGALTAPSHDMLRLLHLCREMNRTTEGLFDPTVQPLWELFSEWYRGRPDRAPPPDALVSEALERVGMEHVLLDGSRLTCSAGTRITLNGIAQGYITDRVAELLRARGWRHVLIDLGEARAMGGKPDGTPWRIGVRETGRDFPIANTALATSAGSALRFDASGTATHIFDPRTGRSPARWRAVSVRHPSAAVADALSTALLCAEPAQLTRIAGRYRTARVWTTAN